MTTSWIVENEVALRLWLAEAAALVCMVAAKLGHCAGQGDIRRRDFSMLIRSVNSALTRPSRGFPGWAPRSQQIPAFEALLPGIHQTKQCTRGDRALPRTALLLLRHDVQ